MAATSVAPALSCAARVCGAPCGWAISRLHPGRRRVPSPAPPPSSLSRSAKRASLAARPFGFRCVVTSLERDGDLPGVPSAIFGLFRRFPEVLSERLLVQERHAERCDNERSHA